MIILGIDTSSMVATAAVLSKEKLMAEYIVNNKKNHSEKMMQVLDRVLQDAGVTLEEVDAIAVAKGPGSFTGIRIGMACAEGIAHALGKPMVGVNTLDGLAYNLMGEGAYICPVIDAQRQEVYTSLYRWREGQLLRFWDYAVEKGGTLVDKLLALKERVVVVGDGVPVLMRALSQKDQKAEEGLRRIIPAHPAFAMPRASSVAAAGMKDFEEGRFDTCYSIKPFYIRRSHAEEKWEEKYGRART